ncbi:MAG: zf-HC2 domain-containing protein [Ignavibacteria bacterium]|nr:zf-HC2 domain-containing protein [Ignavibacteria bacterium]
MTCKEVHITLNDYIDSQLDSISKSEVETHLRTCDKCFNQYKRLRRFLDKISKVPFTADPPADFSTKLTEELMKIAEAEAPDANDKSKSSAKKLKREQAIQEKLSAKERIKNLTELSKKGLPIKSSPLKFISKVLLIIVMLAALAVVGYLVHSYSKKNSPWKVTVVQGNVLISGQMHENDRISEGQDMLTEINSRAIVIVPSIGRIEVEPITQFRLIKAEDGDNRIGLERGEIKVSSLEQLPAFVTEFKNNIVKFIGGTYRITVDEYGKAILFIESGIAEVHQNQNIFMIDENFICHLSGEALPGIPYRTDANEIFIGEVKKIESGAYTRNSIDMLINTARNLDVLTLLAVIPRVNEQERVSLYDKIFSFYKPPPNTTLEGIIKLDQKMLEAYFREIEWQL